MKTGPWRGPRVIIRQKLRVFKPLTARGQLCRGNSSGKMSRGSNHRLILYRELYHCLKKLLFQQIFSELLKLKQSFLLILRKGFLQSNVSVNICRNFLICFNSVHTYYLSRHTARTRSLQPTAKGLRWSRGGEREKK